MQSLFVAIFWFVFQRKKRVLFSTTTLQDFEHYTVTLYKKPQLMRGETTNDKP